MMERLPDSAERRLQDEFHGRVRIRWSRQRRCFMVEQREAESLEPGSVDLNHDNDEQVRARDGFSLMYEVWPGSKAPCPHCGLPVALIPGRIRRYTCEGCKAMGKSSNHVDIASFYPDSEALLQELRKVDYIGHNALDPRERVRRMHAHNTWRAESNEARIRDDRNAYTREEWRRLVGNPIISLGGKEF